jgi:putative ABC transport system permease protein
MKNFLINLGLVSIVALSIIVWGMVSWVAALVLGAMLALWMVLTRTGHQTSSVTGMGMSTLRSRLGSSSVIVIGIAGVVAVLVALLAMGEGFQSTLQSSGRDDTAIVLRGGSLSEAQSVLTRDNIDAITQAPGVARDASNKPLVSPELIVTANLRERGSDDEANTQLRGIDEQAWALRPQLKIIEGRKFKPGLQELVVGQSAHRQLVGLNIGDDVQFGAQTWKVVGIFASDDAYDSELWADRESVSSAFHRGSSAASVLVKLTSASAFAQFNTALSTDPKLKVEAETTHDYFAKQSENLAKVIRIVGLAVGIIMAIGAVFGAISCMFTAILARSREIATLRAIGFRAVPVVLSVMLETMLLALLGGLLGALAVWLVFNGYSSSTLNGFTEVMFRFKVTPALIWTGIKWALAIGFIGGLFPAVRAARLPVVTALREL